MEPRTVDDEYKAVLRDPEAKDACEGCVFSGKPRACLDHACFGPDFPDDHPLRDADAAIIWVRK